MDVGLLGCPGILYDVSREAASIVSFSSAQLILKLKTIELKHSKISHKHIDETNDIIFSISSAAATSTFSLFPFSISTSYITKHFTQIKVFCAFRFNWREHVGSCGKFDYILCK